MDYPWVSVDGVPCQLGYDENGYYATATSQRIETEFSPVVISFDPPIAPTVDLGEVYQAIKAKLPA